jgi:uncharacterized delta-60 repeat protein
MTRSAQSRTAGVRRPAYRPRLDPLEDRQLLTAGALDTTTFKPPNGYVLTDFTSKGSPDGTGNAVQIQSDGKIVVAGTANSNVALARYNSDGSLDSTFGSGGKVQTHIGASKSVDNGWGLALQPDGKLVVVGWIFNGTNGTSNLCVARYNTNGSLDTTFGPNKTGLVVPGFGDYADLAYSVALQSDGSIDVAGVTQKTYNGTGYATVLRFTSGGNLDNSFGSGGLVKLGAYPNSAFTDVKLQMLTVNGVSTTRIVAASSYYTPSAQHHLILARLNLDGSPDTTLGSGGTGVEDFNPGTYSYTSSGLAVQPDGSLIAVGSAKPTTKSLEDIVAVRFDPNGNPDPTFNPAGPVPGMVTIGLSSSSVEGIAAVVQPSDGKILIEGVRGITTQYNNSVIACLNPDGSLDGTFGSSGFVIQSLTFPGVLAKGGIALQADGKIVTAGVALAKGNDNFAVARFLNDTTAAVQALAAPGGSTSASGPVSPATAPSLWVPVAPSAEAFDQALGMVVRDRAPVPMAPVVSLGNAGLPPVR